VERAIIYRLLQSTALEALVARRVHHKIRPQGSPLPAVVINRISGVPVRRLDGVITITTTRIQVDCWAETAPQLFAVVSAVKAALDRATFAHAAAVICGCFLIDEQDDDATEAPLTDQKPLRTRLDFRVQHTPA
jgi:hypothetical protein